MMSKYIDAEIFNDYKFENAVIQYANVYGKLCQIPLRKYIGILPSADVVKVKNGKWIDGHCSECGCDIPAYIEDWHWKKDMNAKYCPNCGADMREKEKTE